MQTKQKKMRVAFILGEFPIPSAAFILNQVADLIDRGVSVRVFTFKRSSLKNVSDRYDAYNMPQLVRSMEIPSSFTSRFYAALPKLFHMLRKNPGALFRALNIFRYGRNAFSLKMLFWVEPWIGEDFDLIHCHFGPTAVKYLVIKDILRLPQKFIVTFYGYDVSQIVKQKGVAYYGRLAREASLVFTMSENMRSRVLSLGFAPEKVVSLPVSIDVPAYPFTRRELPTEGPIKLVSVGRFVEKKGFDDLIRTLALLKKKTTKRFLCYIVGEGGEHDKIHALAKELSVEDVIVWQNFMKEQDLIQYYMDKHLYVQTSKTAANGDME